MVRATRLLLAAGMLVAACALSACGSSSTGGSTQTGTVASATPPESGCGSFPAPAPKDPDGLVAGLPQELRELYGGYPYEVTKSQWADWKPSHAPPYTVGVQWGAFGSDFQLQLYKRIIADLKQNPDISSVIDQSTGANLDVGQQLAQTRSMILKKPDIIILEQTQPQAFKAIVDEAAKAGIPVLVVLDSIKGAVNLTQNYYRGPGLSASVAVRQLGGKGNLLMVHSIPGVGSDNQAFEAYDAILQSCPGLKKAGEVFGMFVNATTKSETLKFLATHPQKIDGVLQAGGMATGIMEAFEQAGRPMPIVQDMTMLKGSAGYWRQHRETYLGAGTGFPLIDFAHHVATVTGNMLAGDGVQFSDVLGNMPTVTDENLDAWSEPGWTLKTPGTVLGPPRDSYLTDAQTDAYFAK